MKTSETLIKARALIADPGSWGKRAREHFGRRCAVGAISQAIYGQSGRLRTCEANNEPCVQALVFAMSPQQLLEVDTALMERFACECRGAAWRVMAFNDKLSTTHQDVLALFDRAIARAEQLERLANTVSAKDGELSMEAA